MQISVLGIGYVGAVSAACLARDGHDVTAVDVAANKVRPLNKGISPIVEPGLDELIKGGIAKGSLRATTNTVKAVHTSDISLVCVGTPSAANGSLSTEYLESASHQLGDALRKKNAYHSVVFRSTMLPGTLEGLLIPKLEKASGKRAGIDFGVGYFPEFLRESTAIKDYDAPGAIIFGALDEPTLGKLKELHARFAVDPIIVDLRVAEAIKYANNAWHALKISFANEIGNLCKAANIDGHSVMEVLCADHRLNISPAYLKPGFAFGGSCLPKDLRALRFLGRRYEINTPVLDATLAANDFQLQRAYEMITRHRKRSIGLLGLSFKSDTDDLRESPLVELVERLHGRGHHVKIYDPNIQIARLTGANLQYVRSRLPHFASMLTNDINRVIDHAEVLVIGNAALGREAMALADDDTPVIDLVRIDRSRTTSGSYEGLCW